MTTTTSTSNALARFEFEAGRTKDCTKVLLVEWEEDETTKHIPGIWTVTWERKRADLAGQGLSSREDSNVHRLYFLLPEGERVPGTVWLTLTPTDGAEEAARWKIHPLPAIFPPSLGVSASTAGKKGVLHTIWAKRRLQVLAREIEEESQSNVEGVALQMAIRERDWIETHFGVLTRPPTHVDYKASLTGRETGSGSPPSPHGGRFMDKLKALKLNTANTGSSATDVADQTHLPIHLNPLSPEQSDVAVSSFGSFARLKGIPDPSVLGTKTPQQQPPQSSERQNFPQRSLEEVVRQQWTVSQANPSVVAAGKTHCRGDLDTDDEREDDLFALPISLRGPNTSQS